MPPNRDPRLNSVPKLDLSALPVPPEILARRKKESDLAWWCVKAFGIFCLCCVVILVLGVAWREGWVLLTAALGLSAVASLIPLLPTLLLAWLIYHAVRGIIREAIAEECAKQNLNKTPEKTP